ncbi:MFS general substrate transporter [Ganoderma sinense ZZ0214-1]|uniref:MFS general substrate transporter n=1 Tax=Ganoderma sinense ZZ0214-1 TaxID=1077348 RepID=A0A2G8RNY9_9APHY|nr:MFS general substrate transporter [Ganoderma sinense ZZ0214-1]
MSSLIDHEKLSTERVTVEESPLSVDPGTVLRKLDLRLVPPVCILYLLCFLDRANIGNAKVAGLASDLHLTGIQFNLCVAITLIPYSLLEIPSNIVLKRVGPSRWLPIIMFVWGAILVSMAFVRSFGGLMTARVFLGSAEAGLLPGLTYYLSAWYPKSALAKRIGVMYSGVSLAGAFGGLLAYAIEKMNGIGALHGWSWIFLLEGLLTVIVATAFYFYMYDYPENATFLTDAERTWLLETIKQDSAGGSKQFKREFIFQALRDPKAYLFMAMFFLGAVAAVSFTVFLPTIINGLGYSSTHAQLLSIPPNATGCVFTLIVSYLSDRKRIRGPFILVGCSVAIVGYAMLIATKTPAIQYSGSVIVAAGLLPSVSTLIAWSGGNFAGEVKRAVVIAIVIGFGNLGGVVGSFIYRQQDSPRYLPGHSACIASLCLFIVLCALTMLRLHALNRSKTAQCEREGVTADKSDAFAELGDSSPLYRYTL